MRSEEIEKILIDVQANKIDVEDAVRLVRKLTFSDLGFAKIDHHRRDRCGFAEVIYTPGKTAEQLQAIVKERLKDKQSILLTKAGAETYEAVKKAAPQARYIETAKLIVIEKADKCAPQGLVVVVTAGTTDIPIAEEAAITAEVMGAKTERIYDVGVAGVHRLLAFQKKFTGARAIVAVAGMEGALPSLIGGMVSVPVIAVPTSVGYGSSFQGLAALLGMLNSCASGVTVVNIDNGFGAGYSAAMINKR